MAMKQQGPVCFASAAVLVATRVFLPLMQEGDALKYVLQANYDGSVREKCGRLPPEVVVWYNKLMWYRNFKDGNQVILRSRVNYMHIYHDHPRYDPLDEGGYANLFLTAMLWSANISAKITYSNYFSSYITKDDELSRRSIMSVRDEHYDTHIFTCMFNVVSSSKSDLQYWIETTEAIVGRNAAAYLIDVWTPDKKEGHVIALFPCDGGYMLCNSNDERCVTLSDASADVQERFPYLVKITFVFIATDEP